MNIKIYDTTLRDGAQQEGLSFSVADKLKIAQKLIDFKVAFIEGGFPGSNPKDKEFFQKAQKLNWKKSNLVAFCPTRHKNNKVEKDPSLKSVLDSGVKYVCVFGKTWDLHAEKILGISKKENLELIFSTIDFLKKKGLKVFFDAEHFFDGYKENKNYALECLKTAIKAGAENLSLCDTNGGSLPWEIEEYTKKVCDNFPKISVGIHVHNDSGLAEANTLSAVKAGADLVQVTVNGYGERTGNANLCAVIPNLVLKMAKKIEPNINLKKLFLLASSIAEIANANQPKRAPFVGSSTFGHKAGVHVSAVAKLPRSYEHIDPELVGNKRHATVSELSGKTNIEIMAENVGIKLNKNSNLVKKVLTEIKKMENEGYAYEGAEASFKLIINRLQKNYKPPFELVDYLVLNRFSRKDVEAEVQIKIGNKIQTEIDFGNGPINALDKALRKTLMPFFPQLKKIKLLDFKVRIIDTKSATAAKTRVLIESGNGNKNWTTIGCHVNITKACLQALLDSLEYAITEN